MNSVLTKIEEIELSILTSILEDGRSSEELFFVGDAKDQASMILSSMKGANPMPRGKADFYKRTMNQLLRTSCSPSLKPPNPLALQELTPRPIG